MKEAMSPKSSKEGAEVVFDEWPTGEKLRSWTTDAWQAITAMSGRPRECLEWLNQTETATIAELEECRIMESIDTKIAKWLLDMTKKKGKCIVADRVNQLKERHAVNKRYLPGRLVLRTILDELRPDEDNHNNVDIDILKSVQYSGNLQAFYAKWIRVNLHARSDVGFSYKLHCFHTQYLKIKGYEDIDQDRTRYKRMIRSEELTDKESKYYFLRKSVKYVIEDARVERAAAADQNDLRRSVADLGAVPGGKGGKYGGKGKGKGGKEGGKDGGKGKREYGGKGKPPNKGKGNGGGGGGSAPPPKKCSSRPEGCPDGTCWDYWKHGSCARFKVNACSFKHNTRPTQVAAPAKADDPSAPSNKGPRSIPRQCSCFKAGKCHAAANCAFEHGDKDARPKAYSDAAPLSAKAKKKAAKGKGKGKKKDVAPVRAGRSYPNPNFVGCNSEIAPAAVPVAKQEAKGKNDFQHKIKSIRSQLKELLQNKEKNHVVGQGTCTPSTHITDATDQLSDIDELNSDSEVDDCAVPGGAQDQAKAEANEAHAQQSASHVPNRVIADTGSGYDIFCKSDLTEQNRKRIQPAEVVVEFHTGNGMVISDIALSAFSKKMGSVKF